MNEKDLLNAMSGIDERFITETQTAGRTGRRVFRRTTVIIAAVIAACIFAGTVFAVSVMNRRKLSDSSYFAAQTDDYASEVYSTVTCEGLTVELTEAIIDNGRMYVMFNADASGLPDDVRFFNPVMESFFSVDGVDCFCECFSESSENLSCVLTMNLDSLQRLDENGQPAEPFTLTYGEHKFGLSFRKMELMCADPENEFRYVDGEWEYTFIANTVAADTVTYTVDKELVLENGDIIRFDSIVCTPFSQTLMFTVESNDPAQRYVVMANATDDLGGAYRFEFSDGFDDDGRTSGRAVNASPDRFNPDAQTVKLNIMVFNMQSETVANVEAVAVKN